MISAYLMRRPNLVGVLLVMDSRRSWDEEEEQMRAFASEYGFKIAVVLTKSDKLNQSERVKSLKTIQQQSDVEDVFLTSNTKLDGIQDVENFVYINWVKDWKYEPPPQESHDE